MAQECPPRYSDKTLKMLFGQAGNRCAFPDCKEPLIYRAEGAVMGVICHIRGRNPGSARYDDSMPCSERNDYPNLVVLCPTHHTRIDEIEPGAWPVERLLELKAAHEDRRGKAQLGPGDIDLVIAVMQRRGEVAPDPSRGLVPRDGPSGPSAGRPPTFDRPTDEVLTRPVELLVPPRELFRSGLPATADFRHPVPTGYRPTTIGELDGDLRSSLVSMLLNEDIGDFDVDTTVHGLLDLLPIVRRLSDDEWDSATRLVRTILSSEESHRVPDDLLPDIEALAAILGLRGSS